MSVADTYSFVAEQLRQEPRTWLVTGAAGFIGSNLVETLLGLGQRVRGLDNYATGYRKNLEQVQALVGEEQWGRFEMIEGDIRNLDDCRRACESADYVLHQAALGSVPRSIKDPIATNESNVTGFLNMLVAARDAGAGRFVYAASSSTYGDHEALPKIEDRIGSPLSPYAVTKYVNELYAGVFARSYEMEVVGLRYFNIFGRRQDPDGAYAAVIPRWLGNQMHGRPCTINGDGETSRDFCYVDNAVQANLLAATTKDEDDLNQVYNVAYGESTTLRELYGLIRESLLRARPGLDPEPPSKPNYGPFRPGDVRHSLADVSKARRLLGYAPTHSVRQGLEEAIGWYAADLDAGPE